MKIQLKIVSICVTIIFLLASCSINKMAINAVSNALTSRESGDVFTGDNDPELVGDAIPFAIKMYEALLSSNPNHEGLRLMTGSLFVMYANAFVQGPAEMLPPDLYKTREEQRQRARNLYLRGAKILGDGLDKKYPGISAADAEETAAYLPRMKKDDVPVIYWYVAANLSAYAINPFDLALGQRLPQLKALIDKAYQMDPDFNSGAIDDFYILFYSSVPESMGGDKALAELHFRKALEKSKGMNAGPYVSFAQAVCVPAQDYPAFKDNLHKAMEIDVNANPSSRLVNIIAQRKAAYLISIADKLFIDIGEDEALYSGDDS